MLKRYQIISLITLMAVIAGLTVFGLNYAENDLTTHYDAIEQTAEGLPEYPAETATEQSTQTTNAEDLPTNPSENSPAESSSIPKQPAKKPTTKAKAHSSSQAPPEHANAGGNSQSNAKPADNGYMVCVMGLCF